jgi:hypothetical protein
MKKLGAIPWVLGGMYAAWCIFVYFCADHAWWPLFLHHPLYPLSLLIEYALATIVDMLPTPSGASGYVAFDRITGLVYLVFGFAWYFLIGLALRRAIRYFRRTRQA